MADSRADKRWRGTLAGIAFIGFGIIGAIVGYIQDKDSFDYLRMSHAKDYAILHLVLWAIAGVIVILWYNRRPDDKLPFETRDDNRDGMR